MGKVYEELKSKYTDDLIVNALIRTEPSLFVMLQTDLRRQLSMMPETEKNFLKYELQEAKEMTEKIKSLGVDLLEREFIH